MAEVEYVAHVIVMPIVLTIGMVNQCLNVCTLLQLPSGGFLYLKASAIADILSIISFIPFLLRHANLNDSTWKIGMLYHAHLELPIINALIASSALCIVAMTVDRYLSVCHPIKFFNSSESKKKTYFVIMMLYLIAFLVYVPSIWQKKIAPKERE
uniref:G_PROTEIN_RECEP_F1_2 domain-containing protein n=1 Tax=Heterorhabditis bacteriophora TaxID=37862 RepID=A0A1I7XG95_HETBA